MADVYSIHEVVPVAYCRSALWFEASCDDYVLAYVVIFTDGDEGYDAFVIAKALWGGTYNGVLVYVVILSHGCASQYAGIWVNDAAVADDCVLVYVGERVYLNVFTYLCLGVDVGQRAYV